MLISVDELERMPSRDKIFFISRNGVRISEIRTHTEKEDLWAVGMALVLLRWKFGCFGYDSVILDPRKSFKDPDIQNHLDKLNITQEGVSTKKGALE